MDCRFTLFISSSDGYEDCWYPFFALLKKYWPGVTDVPIILSTNYKTFSIPDLEISCPTVSKKYGKDFKWGERLLRTLDYVKTDLLLFFLDDYFIRSPIRVERLNGLIELMFDEQISHIMLYPEPGPNIPSRFPSLVKRGQNAEYRFSLQVGLWRKERLMKYLRNHEDPWHAERWGTRRAWQIEDSFYSIDKETFEQVGPIVDYLWTGGLIRGKWSREVTELFERNGIRVDFSSRGFFDPFERKSRPSEFLERIRSAPQGIASMIDLWRLRLRARE